MEIWQTKLILKYLEATSKLSDINIIKRQLKELYKLLNIYNRQYVKTRNNSAAIKNVVLERDDNKCRLCRDTDEPHIHHITPLSVGGDNSIDNIITLCSSCHSLIHYCNPKCRFMHSKLTKEGLKKAKLNGKTLGRKSLSTNPPQDNMASTTMKVDESTIRAIK